MPLHPSVSEAPFPCILVCSAASCPCILVCPQHHILASWCVLQHRVLASATSLSYLPLWEKAPSVFCSAGVIPWHVYLMQVALEERRQAGIVHILHILHNMGEYTRWWKFRWVTHPTQNHLICVPWLFIYTVYYLMLTAHSWTTYDVYQFHIRHKWQHIIHCIKRTLTPIRTMSVQLCTTVVNVGNSRIPTSLVKTRIRRIHLINRLYFTATRTVHLFF